ncbi:MAG: recombinase family protein [Actinobacteria bacterium]|nr:recombinase family protein [Actinomycetota bacterium]
MDGNRVGYARCSTEKQDLRAQKESLRSLGVADERIYVDHGMTGANRDRPGLREALAACYPGDTLVVTKLDRLARSIADARDIADELTARQVRLSFAGSVYDPTDPMGKMMFNMMSVFAEFEADLIRSRTREGMRIAKKNGKLRGKQPKLSASQQAHLVKLHASGDYTKSELADMFSVARSTIGRTLQRAETTAKP